MSRTLYKDARPSAWLRRRRLERVKDQLRPNRAGSSEARPEWVLELVRTRARVAGREGRGAVQSAVVISGRLASVLRLKRIGQPWNPNEFPPGFVGLAPRGALQLDHHRVQACLLGTGHAVEQILGLDRVNECVQGRVVLGGDLAAVLLAYLRCVPVSGVGVVI